MSLSNLEAIIGINISYIINYLMIIPSKYIVIYKNNINPCNTTIILHFLSSSLIVNIFLILLARLKSSIFVVFIAVTLSKILKK